MVPSFQLIDKWIVQVLTISLLVVMQSTDLAIAQIEGDVSSTFLMSEKHFGEAIGPAESETPFAGVWTVVSAKEDDGFSGDLFPQSKDLLEELYVVKIVDDHLFVGGIEWQHEAFTASNHRLTLRKVDGEEILFTDVAEDRFLFARCKRLENGNLGVFLPDVKKVVRLAKKERVRLPLDEDTECLVIGEKLIELFCTLPQHELYEESPALELRRMMPEKSKEK